MLRSTDGGTTFVLLTGPPFVGQGFFDLIVDPTRSNRLFVATTGGVYRSTDGGSTWTNLVGVGCWDLSVVKRGNRVEVSWRVSTASTSRAMAATAFPR